MYGCMDEMHFHIITWMNIMSEMHLHHLTRMNIMYGVYGGNAPPPPNMDEYHVWGEGVYGRNPPPPSNMDGISCIVGGGGSLGEMHIHHLLWMEYHVLRRLGGNASLLANTDGVSCIGGLWGKCPTTT